MNPLTMLALHSRGQVRVGKRRFSPLFDEVRENPKVARDISPRELLGCLPYWDWQLVQVSSEDILQSWKTTTVRNFFPVTITQVASFPGRASYPWSEVLQGVPHVYSRLDAGIVKSKSVPFLARPLGAISSAASKYVEIISMMGGEDV